MSKIKVNLYCDESKANHRNGDNFEYFGLLIVPLKKRGELFENIYNARCIPDNNWNEEGCSKHCGYHKRNNTEIHYRTLSQDHEFKIAKKWINFLLRECKENSQMVYFNILGLNKSLIDSTYWKYYNKKDLKIYSRFLMTAIKSVKYFFHDKDEIIINGIFHDQSPLSDDDLYYQKLLNNLKKDEKIKLKSSGITFVQSDHRKSKTLVDSHFIQFIDLILGLTVNYIHFNTNKNNKKTKLTEKISEILQRLIHSPNNVNSRFNYVENKKIEFFPKKDNFYGKYQGLDGEKKEKLNENLFYSDISCEFEETHIDEDQETLLETMNRLKDQ